MRKIGLALVERSFALVERSYALVERSFGSRKTGLVHVAAWPYAAVDAAA